MIVKKNLSIDDELLEQVEARAKSLNLKFTTYIQILVNQDLGRDGIDHPMVGINKYLKDKEIKPKKKEIKEDIDMSLYRSAAKEAMAIMDM
jgi:hypothetical protein